MVCLETRNVGQGTRNPHVFNGRGAVRELMKRSGARRLCSCWVKSPFNVHRTAIFESFEPESDEEEDEEEEAEAEDDYAQKLTTNQDPGEVRKMKELALQDFPDDDSAEDEDNALSEEDDIIGTGVQTSQLRHFVIQVRHTSCPASS